MWGLDAVGPFRTAPGGQKHILVDVDKFTKWIEVRPVAKVTLEEAAKFIVGVSYVVTKVATTLESMWVYYIITDKSASARIPL
jgi:hypothetical protein